MSKSNSIRASDAARLMRAVSEAYESSAETEARLTRLVTSGCDIIGARMGSACRAVMPRGGGRKFQLISYLEGGVWTDRDRHMLRDYYTQGDHEQDLMAACLSRRWRDHGLAGAALRQQIIADDVWYSSNNVNEFRRPTDIDSCIYAGLKPDADLSFGGLTIHRAWGEHQFTERQRLLVEVLLAGAAFLLHAYVQEGRGISNPLETLPPRLRDVLQSLVEGDSEKQAARRYGLATSTVHSHVKRLYRAFGVHSRGELFARLVELRLLPALRPRHEIAAKHGSGQATPHDPAGPG